MLIGALGAMGSLANSLTPRQDGAHSRGHKQCSEPGRKKKTVKGTNSAGGQECPLVAGWGFLV